MNDHCAPPPLKSRSSRRRHDFHVPVPLSTPLLLLLAAAAGLSFLLAEKTDHVSPDKQSDTITPHSHQPLHYWLSHHPRDSNITMAFHARRRRSKLNWSHRPEQRAEMRGLVSGGAIWAVQSKQSRGVCVWLSSPSSR